MLSFKKGDSAYIVWNKAVVPRGPQYLLVSKVGRNYLHLENGMRAFKDTGTIDGDGTISPGTVWQARKEYQDYKKRLDIWKDLREYVNIYITPPVSIHGEQISAFLELLKPKFVELD